MQKVNGFFRRRIEFAVMNAGTGRHRLHFAGRDDGAGSQTVLVFQPAGKNDADNFHIVVRMSAEPSRRRNDVVVNHPQVAERHKTRIIILPERKSMAAVEPVGLSAAALVGLTQIKHVFLLLLFVSANRYGNRRLDFKSVFRMILNRKRAAV